MSLSPPDPVKRASDADRERVAAQLRDHMAEGRITTDELSHRLDLVYAAPTLADLASVTEDLPAPVEDEDAERPRKRTGFRRWLWRSFFIHFGAYASVNGGLIAIWAASGDADVFWPVYPIAGWGMGIGIHFFSALAGGSSSDYKKYLKETGQLATSGDRRGSREVRRQRHERHRDRHEQRHELRRELRREAVEWSAWAREVAEQRVRKAIDQRRVFREQSRTPSPPLPAPEPGRKWVTVLFSDIVESTRLTEALGDEEWLHVRSRHRELLRSVFEDHAGSVVATQGDGFLARFGAPDDAVRAAIAIQRKLAQAREEIGFALKVRIGIHTGQAMEDDGDLVGKVVNLASRVMTDAAPSEILVTEPVADHVGTDLKVEDRGLRELRGVSQPRHLLAVLWE